MYLRVNKSSLGIHRYNTSVARYKMLKHGRQWGNPDRNKILSKWHLRMHLDGLNNLE